ncbi:hypothetical protein ACF068_14605 [Streptomyces sp. NPDC016309]|uniref:hypothetical protein n=1 Tax=Streptomyces sp. NPDC016309 TaxID=3364965 RepID=UPI0036F88DBD
MAALAVIAFGVVAMLAGLALVALAPPTARHAYVLPTVRTVAFITAATAAVVGLFHL